MKRLALAGIVTLAFALGGFAQGIIDLDNSAGNYGLCVNGSGGRNWYSGTFGMEVWELSGVSAIPLGINFGPFELFEGSGAVAYYHMVGAGFKKEATFANQATCGSASFCLGECDMPDVSPAGSQVVLALVAWNTSDASFSAMLARCDPNTCAGVVAFVNATGDPTASPPGTPQAITGWDSVGANLVMMPLGDRRGDLQVSISPPSVVSAGAQWQLDGGEWQKSGTILTCLPCGPQHTVAFSSVTNWITPPSQTVSIYAPGTATGTYMPVFNYTTNNGAITITGYTGPGGSVTIPNTIDGLPVTSIRDGAFYGCTSLTNFTIPNSVTNIGVAPFQDCCSLTAITVDALNAFYSSAGAVLFNKSQTTLIRCPGGKAGNYTIPNSVTTIGDFAFYACGSLTSVTIGNSVASIGRWAFSSCTALTSVMIPNSVTSIGDGAFTGCTSLTSVYFQGNAASAGSSVFDGDTKATVYYFPGTTGWGPTFAGLQTVLWNPQMQTRNANFGVRTNRFGFTITGNSGLMVVVEACTNLVNPSWTPVQTNTLNGNSLYFSDPQWTNYRNRFYRFSMP